MINTQDFGQLTEIEITMIARFLAIGQNPSREDAETGIAIALYAFEHPHFANQLENLIRVQQTFGGSPAGTMV